MSVDNTIAERDARYGDFTDHAELAQELQDIMRGFRKVRTDGKIVNPWAKLDSVKRQALTVIADKIARVLSGDPNYVDNWHDIQGYAKLAEDRCVDLDSPQLDLGDAIAADDAFRDAVVFGQGATLNVGIGGSTYVDLLAGQHLARREQDEYVCSRCAKRWGVDEDAPEECNRLQREAMDRVGEV